MILDLDKLDFEEFAGKADHIQLADLKETNEKILEGFHSFGYKIEAPTTAEQTAEVDITKPEAKNLNELLEQKHQIEQLELYLYLNSKHANVREILAEKVDALITQKLDDNNNPNIKDPWDIAKYHKLLHLCSFGGQFEKDSAAENANLIYKFNTKSDTDAPQNASMLTMAKLKSMGLIKEYEGPAPENNLTLQGQALLKRLNETRGQPEVTNGYNFN